MTDTTPAPRPTRDRTLPIVFSVLGAIVVVGILVTLLVPQARFGSDSSGSVTIDDQFSAVSITSEIADTKVVYRDVDSAEVTFQQHDLSRDMDFSAAVSGSTLDVRVTDNRSGWHWPSFSTRSPLVTVVLPTAMAGMPVTFDGDVGDVDLRGEFGDLRIETTAGDLKLDGSATRAQLDTTVGDVTLDLDAIPDALDVTATAGDVEVSIPRGTYRVETDTNVGDVTVDIPNDPSATTVLHFETTVGDIRLGS